MHTTKATIACEKKTRMDMIKKCSEESCIKICEGQWYRCACEILQHNRINTYVILMLLEIFSHAAVGNSKTS